MSNIKAAYEIYNKIMLEDLSHKSDLELSTLEFLIKSLAQFIEPSELKDSLQAINFELLSRGY